MAENSKREQIIVASKTLLESVASISTVKRTLQSYSDLQEFAGPQFPVCAIVGRLPDPLEKRSGRGSIVDQIISELKIDVMVYLLVNEDMDTLISNVADDLFAKLYTDQERGGLVFETLVKITEKTNAWAPFAAFQMTVIHKYVHTTGGI